MRILIITHYFPPLNKPGSSRPHAWARYWKEAGHEVHVLTTVKGRHDGNLNYFIPKSLRLKENLTEIGYWPYSAGLIRQDQQTQYYNNKIDQSFAKEKRPLSKYHIFNKISKIRQTITPIPSIKTWWIKSAVKYATRLHNSWPYDVVVSTFSPVASHIIGSILKKKKKIFWVADYRDLMTGDTNFAPKWPLSSMLQMLERHFLSRADLITTVSDPLRDQLMDFLKKPVVTIEHGFDPAEVQSHNTSFFPRDNKMRLVHTGYIFPWKRDPSPLFSAINRLKSENSIVSDMLEVLFYGPKSEHLDKLIQQYEITDCICQGGQLGRQASFQVQREADALLFFEWNIPTVKGLLSSKIFEYIFSGKPILSIGASVSNSADEILRKSGTGIILNRSVEKIETALKQLLKDKSIAYKPDLNYIAGFHKRELSNKFISEIQKRIQI
jgi:hypothetical protein